MLIYLFSECNYFDTMTHPVEYHSQGYHFQSGAQVTEFHMFSMRMCVFVFYIPEEVSDPNQD